MLAVDRCYRKQGIGKEIMDFCLELGKQRGYKTGKIQLVVPRDFDHEFKAFLKRWYIKVGFQIVSQIPMEEHPDFLGFPWHLLLTPCDVLEMEKIL